MKLSKVRVRYYKNIVDSTPVEFEDNVTALVGKNESGKTSFLRALYALNPVPKEAIRFDVVNDYPRWRKVRDERESNINEVCPVSVTFSLSPAEIAELSKRVGVNLTAETKLSAMRNYAGDLLLELEYPQEKAWVSALVTSLSLDRGTQETFDTITTFDHLRTEADSLRAVASKNKKRKSAGAFRSLMDEIDKINSLRSTTNLPLEVTTWLESHLPQFFYFSEYSELPGRIDLQQLVEKRNSSPQSLEPKERTTLSLLSLVGVAGQELMSTNFEIRKAELEAAANEITQQVFEYWTQNKELEVDLEIDSEVVAKDNGRQQVAHKFLDIRLRDLRHGMTTNFSTRSTGFQWFFSFVAAFSEYEKKNVIVLLDEPGLGLHARAQADLLRYIDKRLAPKNQVIYTTHSPFMINPNHLERARLVEDRSTRGNLEQGSIISSDVLSVTDDTRFPLQAALGYDLAQNLFWGGDCNLVVEGPADFVYLNTLSEYLNSINRTGLDPRWTIVPVGGIDKVPTFVALLGAHLEVTVLIDARSSVNQKLINLVTQGLLKNQRLVNIGQVLGMSNADIEDMFTIPEYLTLYNAAFSSSIEEGTLVGNAPIIQRIEQVVRQKFDHLSPAKVLLEDKAGMLHSLSEQTLTHFESLFSILNSTLSDL